MGLDAFRRLRQIGADLIGQVGPPIGVDFGVGTLKLLQVRGQEPPSLTAAACIETPLDFLDNDAGRLEFQLQALSKLVKEGRFEGRRVVCSIPAAQTWCKPMQLIKNETSPIADQVMGAASSQLGCDPGALVYRHLEVEGTTAAAGKTEVICMATPREFVKRVVAGLKGSGLEPVGMHSEFAAAVRSFEAVNRRAADQAKTTLYLDIGGGSTKIMIAHGASMVFARCVDVGGRQFDETIVRQTKWDVKEAHATRLKLEDLCPSKTKTAAMPASPANPLPGMAILAAGMRSGGAEPAAAVAQAPAPSTPDPDLSEPLEMLTDEVALSLRYHESLFPGRKIERVIFLGGESKSRSLCQNVARVLKLPAQLADPLARVGRSGNEPVVGVDLKQPQPGWAVALGLALSPTDL
jgi:type IV pilus assembly protein PilM